MKKLKKLLITLGIIILVWIIIGFIPPLKSTKNNEWLEYREELNRPLISAHRGGSLLNPENTQMAFDYIVEHDLADIIEFDVRVTKDNELVIIHDATVDRVAISDYEDKKASDSSYAGDIVINEITYTELLNYNLGLNFKNKDGEKPYSNITLDEAKELGLTIMLLSDFLDRYKDVDIKILIEIKEKGDLAKYAADKVIELLDGKFNCWKKNAMIISFDDPVINYIAKEYPEQLIGALGYNILPEIAVHTFRLSVFYKANYSCIQTKMVNTAGPLKINAATKSFVKQAHRRNQTIAFWTINNSDDMDVCIEIGADIITTDAPDLLSEKLGRI